MPGFGSNYVSPWLLRSQENKNKPTPLSLNKPVVKKNNSIKRIAFAPVKTAPKTRKGRKAQKTRKIRR